MPNKTMPVMENGFGQYYRRYQGISALCVENQPSGYFGNSAQLVFNYAVDSVKLHFLPWTAYMKTDRAYNFHDALEVINNEKGRINTTPPSNVLKVVSSQKPVEKIDFSVFPNPASDFIILKFPAEFKAELKYQIFDITGKQMESKAIRISEPFISVKHLSNGTYILKLSSNDNSKLIKFIKN
jgi:hypothetical protein